jgi:hypothetical protein
MAVETPYDPTLPIPQTEDDDVDGEERMEMDQGDHQRIVVLGNEGKSKKKKGKKNDGNVEKTTADSDDGLNATMNEFLPTPPISLAIGDGNVQLGRAMKKAVKKAVRKRKKHQIKMG